MNIINKYEEIKYIYDKCIRDIDLFLKKNRIGIIYRTYPSDYVKYK